MLIISGRERFRPGNPPPHSFNLAIEMLIISGRGSPLVMGLGFLFQSRNRDAYHFRTDRVRRRGRIYHRFNLAIEMLIISGTKPKPQERAERAVSISQSRCLSFQVDRRRPNLRRLRRFNLAIEMLIISGQPPFKKASWMSTKFQSRNRDAYHFRCG